MNKHCVIHKTTTALALLLLAGCSNGTGEDPANAMSPTNTPSAGASASAPAASSARSTMGVLITRVDGHESLWQILAGVPGDELRRPSASIAAQGPMLLLSLQGTAAEDRSRQAVISATLMSQGEGFNVVSHDLFVHPEGARGPQLQARELEIEWDRLELDAQGGHVKGRFSGSVCPVGSTSGADDGCVPLEGSFESEVDSDEVLQDTLDGVSGGQP